MGSYYINASTSLIQAEVSTIVYLSTLNAPGSLITVRDYAGKASSNSSIILSTTFGNSFIEFQGGYNVSSYIINQPFGFLTVSPRTSSMWTLVNSYAFPNPAAAIVDQLTAKIHTVSSLTGNLISSQQIIASTIGVNTTNPQYAVDVNGILNASDIYKNGIPFTASGDIPIIRTSTVSINGELLVEPVVTSTLLTFNNDTPYISYNYGESWSTLSAIPLTTTPLNPIYDPTTGVWNYFARENTYLQTYQSYDLVNWTGPTNLLDTLYSPMNVSFENTFYTITINGFPTFFTLSSDFSISNSVTLSGIENIYSVRYFSTQNIYVMTGSPIFNFTPNFDSNLNAIQFSSDLITWNTVSTIGPDTANANIINITDVLYGLGLYIVGGSYTDANTLTNYTGLLYTNNLSSISGFSNTDLPVSMYPIAMAFNGTTFVCLALEYSVFVTANTNIYYSLNGSNWIYTGQTFNTINSPQYLNTKVKWNGVNFVVTNKDEIPSYYSSDGITWTQGINSATFTDYTIGITSTIQTRPNLSIGQTKVFTRDPDLVDSNINSFIFYDNMMKINNRIYLSNTGQVGIGTSTMNSIFNVNGLLTTSSLDFYNSNTHLTASAGTVFINDDPIITSTTLGNFTIAISTLSTLNITESLNVLNPGLTGVLYASSIGINCNSPQYQLDVSGSMYALNLFAQGVSAPQIVATQIGVNCNSPTDAVDVNGTLRATTAWFNTLGVNTDIPSYTLDVNGSLNTTQFFINGVPYVPNQVPPISSLVLSTIVAFGPGGSNVFIPSTFFDKPIFTTILNTSSLKFYNGNTPTTANEPLTINSFLSVNNRNTSNIWVAFGQEGGAANSVRTSTDGINWTQTLTSIGTENYGGAIAYNGKQFLVGFTRGNGTTNFYSSSNGITWSSNILTGNVLPNFGLDCLIWTGTYWITCGSDTGSNSFPNRTIARSVDGSNWSYVTNGGLANSTRGIAYNGYRMVGVGYPSGNASIKYSDDQGNTWTNITANGFSGVQGGGLGIGWNGYMWVAVGADVTQNNSIKYSFNGINWSNVPANGFLSSGAFGGQTVAWNGYMWVAGGTDTGNNTLKYSYDGINWSNGTGVFTGASAQSVAWNGRLWVANGSGGQIKYSLNGINWSNGTGAFAGVGPGVAFSSNVFPDLQVDNLSFFGKNLFNTVQSTNSIHLQTSSILINNAIRIAQPQLTVQNLNNPTVDIIGPTRVQTLLAQSTLAINNTSPLGVLDIQLPSTSGVFSNFPITRGAVNLETSVSTFLNTINTWCALMPMPLSNGNQLAIYYRGGTSGNSNYKAAISGTAFFTGQHANLSVDSRIKVPTLSTSVGLIVSSADQGYYSILANGTIVEGRDAIWITEALPKIKLTDKDMDKAVWGVITNHLNENYTASGQRDLDYQSMFASPLQGRLRVNGVGEGAIWITNINGNLSNGDYICSSVIPGYGRKQDDDVVHNYTVAKITMSCIFNLNQTSYRCEEFQFNGQTYRRAYVGCTYHCS